MSFFLINGNTLENAKSATKISIKDAGIKEASLRDLVAKKINEFFPDTKLFLITTEYSGWSNSNRSLDILAIDDQKNIVVIELKRDNEAAHAELQALRYAAMLSVCTMENIIDAGVAYRKKISDTSNSDNFRKELLEFLEEDDFENITLREIPKIFLVSSDFSKDLTTTVLWLNEKFGSSGEEFSTPGLDISCFQANVYELEGNHVLHFDQIIPIPQTGDYQVRARAKEAENAKQAAMQKSQKTWKILEKKGLLTPGTEITHIKQIPNLNPTDSVATYLGSGAFSWDGSSYASLNAATKALWNKYDIPSGSIQAPAYWRRNEASQPLSVEAGN